MQGKDKKEEKRECKKEERLAAATLKKSLRTRGCKKDSLGRGRGITTQGGQQCPQSVKQLEYDSSEEETETNSSHLIKEGESSCSKTNIAHNVSKRPACNTKPPVGFQVSDNESEEQINSLSSEESSEDEEDWQCRECG